MDRKQRIRIGGMDGSKEKRIRRRMDGGMEGWMDKEKDG